MARAQSMTIAGPLGGVRKQAALQWQEPFSCYDALNFWPVDAKTGRAMLATRPGFASWAGQGAVNMISVLGVAPGTTFGQQLMIARAGNLYRHTVDTTFVQAGTNGIIDTGRNVQAASYYKKLYVANETQPYKVYNFATHGVSDWTATPGKGTIPDDCRLITSWASRMVLAGDVDDPHVVNFSRADDPDDWEFGLADDVGAAYASPDIGQPVTCLIHHNRQCLLAGTYNSLWIFRGNPQTGSLERIGHVVGPINGTAWCKDPWERTWFLSRDGLYRMDGECGSPPISVSREKIPEALLGLDGINNKAYMEYDVRFRMIHIYVQGTDSQYYHFFPETESFWPVSSPGAGILAIGRFDPLETADVSGVLVGTTADLVRLDRTAGTGAAGHVDIGPFSLNRFGRSGLIRHAALKFGSNTNDTTGTVTFYGAQDAESVVARPNNRKFSKTIGSILNNENHCRPRVGGQAGMIRIAQNDNSKHISFELAELLDALLSKERG